MDVTIPIRDGYLTIFFDLSIGAGSAPIALQNCLGVFRLARMIPRHLPPRASCEA